MIHPLLEQQFAALQGLEARAELVAGPDGVVLIKVPDVALEPALAWNKPMTRVLFIAPLGYPQARPDSFWTEGDVRLSGGGLPMNTTLQPIPQWPLEGQVLWFSWHVSSWDPNIDSLITYLNVIRRRLREPR